MMRQMHAQSTESCATQPGRRRGAGIAAVVLMMVVLNLAILGVVSSSGDDLSLAALRLESCRAFYAAESGGVIVTRLVMDSRAAPVGTTLDLPHAAVQFISAPLASEAGTVVVEGASGDARRRIEIELEAP